MDAVTFKKRLNQKNCRLTQQRLAVLAVIANEENRHSSAIEIYETVKAKYPGIGLATVYKTLRLLEQEGVVGKIELLNKTAHYEISDNRPIHCHLVCAKCGKIREVADSKVQSAMKILQSESHFVFQKGSILFYGICENCARSRKHPPAPPKRQTRAAE